MDTNVVLHPAAKLREMIDAADAIDVDYFVEMLIFAFEKKTSRTPLLELVSFGKVTTIESLTGIRRFVEWCRNVKFQSEDNLSSQSIDKDPPTAEAPPPEEDPRAEKTPHDELHRKVRDAGGAMIRGQQEMYDYGYNHKYWFFLPAWEVDTALWEQVFGEHDPCKVITFYLREFFKNNTTDQALKTVVLKQDDLCIIEFIFSFGCKELYEGQSSTPEMQNSWRRALITACSLGAVVDEGVDYEDEDICALVCKFPEWIAIRLIDYWLVRFGDLLDGIELRNEEADLGRTLEQFRFVVGSVIKHLTTPSEYGLEEVSEFSHEELESFPSFEHISDDTIYTVCEIIQHINASLLSTPI